MKKPGKPTNTKARKRARDRVHRPGVAPTPTPIFISSRVLALVIGVIVLVFALMIYAAPIIPIVAFGGMALAIVLSFPVRALSRVMPRGLAILITFLALIGLVVLALVFLVPSLLRQLGNFILIVPTIANDVNRFLLDLIQPLRERDVLLIPSERFMESLVRDLFERAQQVIQGILGGLVGFISGAFNFGIALFGILFVAIYLLVDVRKVKAAYLKAAPVHYRRDARELWDAFGFSLSRYLGGLLLVVVVQGVLATLALQTLGVPYAILLGVWVSMTAIIPYLGPFLGGIPAVIVALTFGSSTFESNTTTAVLTVIAYVLIQQFEGNFLTPRVQGQALHVHPIFVLLAVIGGGQLAGLAGIIFAVPTLAILRVVFDFFRARLRTPPAQPLQDPDL